VPGGVWPFVVVGAGAAGLLAGIFAARGGVRTLLLETRKSPGAKIRVSGGARCNVLPSALAWDDFHTHGSLNTVRNVLQSWPLAEVRTFFEEELGVPLKVEETGKVFPQSDDPREVVVALLGALERAGAALVGGVRIASLRRRPEGTGFELEADDGRRILAERVCLATGGLSLPKTGSDGRGFEFARAQGHSLVELRPALVPLLAGEPVWSELAGISLVVRANVLRGDRRIDSSQGDFLFTHKGFSGPVVLDVSWRFTGPDDRDARLEVAWLGDGAPPWDELLARGGKQTLGGALREHLPRRLAHVLVARAGLEPESALAALSRDGRKRLVRELLHCELAVAGHEGYRTAEVTDGGVPLAELRTATLESRLVPGLHFAGEIVDVCGRIGGYNFLWAWVSGRKVGAAVAAAAGAAQ
jgi:predicted Rossmann fold flavoprotein